MAVWVKELGNPGYLNLDLATRVYASQDGANWYVRTSGQWLEGTYATQADAETAARRLVNGLTVADLTA